MMCGMMQEKLGPGASLGSPPREEKDLVPTAVSPLNTPRRPSPSPLFFERSSPSCCQASKQAN